jgi:tetratricopeptide (TPR) repeat protein
MAVTTDGRLLGLAVVLSLAAVGVAVFTLMEASRAPAKPAEAEESDLSDRQSIENRLHDAEARLEVAEKRVQELTERVTRAEKTATEAAATADRAVAPRNPPTMADAEGPAAPPAGDAARKSEADALLVAIREGRPGDAWGRFQRARELGILDDAIAEAEKYAAAHPAEADPQIALAAAYTVKLMATPDGMERGTWAMKALGCYDAALKVDPENWDAQFSRGVNLSRWPAFLGKQPEAIQAFERLIEQQSRTAPEPKFAQTYYQLGNTYREAGNVEKAREVFRKGAALFPDDKTLREQVDLLEKK